MSKKILIIEDEPAQATTIELFMKRAGFDTIIAHDGAEGLEKAMTTSPDLILLDLVLPKIDGVSVLKQIRANDAIAKIPVLVLTNLASGDTVKEVIDAGGTDYLVKTDYTLDQLVHRVENVLK
ncbi:MAG: hypothetical protein US71_C0004G0054 [Parcubacteria group bacterium GW2011_GWD2_38_12]|nr:MAG: hypothetical protein US06_C0015G0013 [Parcubacteria group bacterium GW2011_GWC2_36_17]KKQ52329.1 MAG: hypothetical protein US71_C0004G0054 [Parcubacteria group bacterium GW2011_GWD2_38_12]KKQ58613.1 MAG: hypothetical protein US79_C0005G0065 [Parcubacteria group bacterium GW2011_GWC1_38_17]KKQ58626.1 MAG: hypothetical protein US78_C0015G0007 [Parcubacteria group bacterium GW2011_GWD1_38_16]